LLLAVVSLMSITRENRIIGERKGYRYPSRLWHGNSCIALFVTSCFLHLIISLQSWVNILVLHGLRYQFKFFLYLLICQLLIIHVQIIYCLVNHVVVCWLLYRRRLGRPRVYRWLLGVEDIKPQRPRLTTQPSQHTQHLLTTPRSPKCYTTEAQELRGRLRCPYLHQQSGWVLHHRCSQVLIHRVCCPSLLHWSPQVLLCSQLLHRGSQMLHNQGTRMLHYNLRCSQLLHWSS
jgi:hypothetical protein